MGRRPILLVVLALALGAPAPAAACTDTFRGGPHAQARDPALWSKRMLPGPNDAVCFPHGMALDVSGGWFEFRSIQGLTSLHVANATVLLTDPVQPTVIPRLSLGGTGKCSAALGGTSPILVTQSFLWGRDGTLLGPGDVLLGPGTRTLIAPGPWRSVFLLGGRLVNDGDLTWREGYFLSQATVVNEGLFEANSETGEMGIYLKSLGQPHIHPARLCRNPGEPPQVLLP